MSKHVKGKVVSFRLNQAQYDALVSAFGNDKIVGVKSPNTLARKLALDWSSGKLAYRNPKDKLVDPEVASALA
jgi:hypothetical protein